jgi:cell division protein FtsB
MKFDFKKIAILFLLISSTGFGLTWYLGGHDVSKQKVKELEEKYKKLEQEKEAAEAKVAAWKEIYDQKDAKDKKLAIEVGKAKADVLIARQNAEKSKAELTELKGGMEETRKEIEDMKNNPKVLTDDELLEDLIKNTK